MDILIRRMKKRIVPCLQKVNKIVLLKNFVA